MTTTKKLVIAVVALSLALIAFAGTTLAWLTAESSEVENTFTYGKVALTLDEADVDEYGQLEYKDEQKNELKDRVIENEYKLVPGSTYVKDPIVHVTEESEECYVFVKVVNGLEAIVDGKNNDIKTIEEQMAANGWLALDSVENVWYYKEIVDARTEAVDLPVFESFTVIGTAVVADYKDASITIQAYAVQKANIDTVAEAWAIASAQN